MGGKFTAGNLLVSLTSSIHSTSMHVRSSGKDTNRIIITIDGQTAYFDGYTDVFRNMNLISESFNRDLHFFQLAIYSPWALNARQWIQN